MIASSRRVRLRLGWPSALAESYPILDTGYSMLDARCCELISRPARQHSTRLGIQFIFPQITQIDADISSCVDLRYLRHLRAKRGGWMDRESRNEYRGSSSMRSIDDKRGDGKPDDDTDEQRSVGEEGFSRAAAELVPVEQVEVAEEPVEHDRYGG